ncbi:phosphotransferase enzyme family protein [Oxobacter pfennigii]|uniref:Phosphotransferase enzyme family protein n=1 Tax=Oxobacter pfennigii TaxID=36849 RepID=A0A0P9AK60_9CLOT|nr:aminoglycoside phosphotransferase family protein [Oxobacter pfennigii]KPU45756.1 phosphotransferase enzyme family protein [Oxobacter pfennigii]
MTPLTEKTALDIIHSVFHKKVNIKAVGNHELNRHLVYHVTDENNLSVIFKIYFIKNRANREVASLKLLSKSSVKCPELIDYRIINNEIDWIMIEYLEGQLFEQAKKNISDDSVHSIFEGMGEELGKIHSFKTFDFFGNWDENCKSFDNIKSYKERFIALAESCIEDMLPKTPEQQSLFDKAINKLRSNYDLMDDITEARLCHNDYNGRNILVKAQGNSWSLSGIIDFEQCLPGNKDVDIALLHHDYFLYNKDYEKAFLKGYNKYCSIDESFYKRLDYYFLFMGIYICSWAYKSAPSYYEEGLRLLSLYGL